MSQLNPFVAAIVPASQVQQQKSAERVSAVRRTQELQKNAARANDQDVFEHTVESADAVSEVKDEEHRKQQRGSHSRPTVEEESQDEKSDEPPHLDITG